MKAKYGILALVLAMGISIPTLAKEASLGTGVGLPDIQVGKETGPKGARKTAPLTHSKIRTGVWYSHCPVKTNVLLSPKHEAEVTLSNGKRIMLSNAALKNQVEKDLKKYEPYMY